MPVTGFLMVYFGHIDLTNRAWYWLDLAIVIYVVLVIISIGIQRPTVQRMIQLTTRPPAAAGAPAAGGAPATAGAPASRRPWPDAPAGAAGAPPAGPPPEVRATAARIRRNGMVLGLLLVVMIFLMVVKPQF